MAFQSLLSVIGVKHIGNTNVGEVFLLNLKSTEFLENLDTKAEICREVWSS